MTSVKQVVVIGAGQAGSQVGASLRDHGFTGMITVVGDEGGLPYQRPPLSKAYLTTEMPDTTLLVRARALYESLDIIVIEQDSVVRIDRPNGSVVLSSGRAIDFEHLVIAAGARARTLPVPGANLDGVVALRTLDDARRLRSSLTLQRNVVVIGGGFIGTEVAAAATKNGHAVTIVEAASRLMSRVVSPDVSTFVAECHLQRGTSIRLKASAVRLIGENGKVVAVELNDGKVIPADVVVTGIGVIPNTELASAAGVAVKNGILVDEHLRTTDPRISAVGDCVAFPCAHAGGSIFRLESVQNAVDQARHVAATITGSTKSGYAAVPWFWTDQFGTKIQMAGIGAHDGRLLRRGSPEDGSFSVLRFGTDGYLTCVESVNRSTDHMAARKLLANRGPHITAFEDRPNLTLKELATELASSSG